MATKSKTKKATASISKQIKTIQSGIDNVAKSKGLTLTKNADGSFTAKKTGSVMDYGAAGRGEVLGAMTDADAEALNSGPAYQSATRKKGETDAAFKARIRSTPFALAGRDGSGGGAPADPKIDPKAVTAARPKIGDRGAAVSALQEALNKKYGGKAGYTMLKVDGIYGPKTQAADNYQDPGETELDSELEDPGSADTELAQTGRYERQKGLYDEDIADAEAELDGAYENPDLKKITKEKREQAQGLIDSVKTEFDRVIGGQIQENAGMDARTRALNISAGLAGSDFATAAAVKTENEGKQKVEAIQAQKQAKIEAILSDVEARASDEFRTQRNEYLKSVENRLDRLKESKKLAKEDALSTLKGLAELGVDIETLKGQDKKTYETLLKDFGGSQFELEVAWNAGLPDDQKVKYDQEVIKGKNGNAYILRYGVNPRTGSIDKKEYDLGVNYDVYAGEKPIEADGVLYTRNADGSLKPLTKKQPGSGDRSDRKTIKSGSAVFTGDQLSAFEKELQASKSLYGGDGQYVNPEVYQEAYAAWIEAGGQQKEFLNEFPPSKYVNPKNNTLPEYLRTANKTSSTAKPDDEDEDILNKL